MLIEQTIHDIICCELNLPHTVHTKFYPKKFGLHNKNR